jgi:hypothetical protein
VENTDLKIYDKIKLSICGQIEAETWLKWSIWGLAKL